MHAGETVSWQCPTLIVLVPYDERLNDARTPLTEFFRILLGEESAVAADREIGISHAKQHQADQWHEGECEQPHPEDDQHHPGDEQRPAPFFPDVEMTEPRHEGQRSGTAGMGCFFQRIHRNQRRNRPGIWTAA